VRKSIIFTALFLVIGILGWSYIGQAAHKEAERIAEEYYTAIVTEDYENAFEYLYLYDYGKDINLLEGTVLNQSEAKQFFLKKTQFLKSVGYKVK
jgi:tryptophan synthase beta subunit